MCYWYVVGAYNGDMTGTLVPVPDDFDMVFDASCGFYELRSLLDATVRSNMEASQEARYMFIHHVRELTIVSVSKLD